VYSKKLIPLRVGKIVAQLQRYCYWPQMNETISKYIKGSLMCATNKPSNKKLGFYTPLTVPSQPWESISPMELVFGETNQEDGQDDTYKAKNFIQKIQ
jgi:hypothetical protein